MIVEGPLIRGHAVRELSGQVLDDIQLMRLRQVRRADHAAAHARNCRRHIHRVRHIHVVHHRAANLRAILRQKLPRIGADAMRHRDRIQPGLVASCLCPSRNKAAAACDSPGPAGSPAGIAHRRSARSGPRHPENSLAEMWEARRWKLLRELVVAAKPGSARLPAAALLKARNVRRDNVLRDVDMLSPQGGWRWQVAMDSNFRGSKIALSESRRTIENLARACQIDCSEFFSTPRIKNVSAAALHRAASSRCPRAPGCGSATHSAPHSPQRER